MKKKTINILLYFITIILLIVGVILFFYPLVSKSISNTNSENAIENFVNYKNNHITNNKNNGETTVSKDEKTNTELLNLYNQMKSYNEKIYEDNQSGLTDPWSFEQMGVNLIEYGLNDCPVGVLKVPKMDVKMPLYLGASYNNMAKGATQLGQTSMPIGGNNTNCVIAGHRGWNGANYFLQIENLKYGDKVYIENFWETLTYKVTDIKVIKPDNIDAIKIEKNKDMVTLITCHPYWDNTYRYVVYCTRIKDNSDKKDTQVNKSYSSQKQREKLTKQDVSAKRIKVEQASYIVIPIVLFLMIALMIVINHKNKK